MNTAERIQKFRQQAERHLREDCPDDEPCELCMTVQEAWEERQAAHGDFLYDCMKDERGDRE